MNTQTHPTNQAPSLPPAPGLSGEKLLLAAAVIAALALDLLGRHAALLSVKFH